MKPGNINDTVEVEVILGRRLIGTFMTIYMPTILLNIIGHSTNYFKPFFFEAVVTVNLTVEFWSKMWPFNQIYFRSCWSWQQCLLELAQVCQRQVASRWWIIGSCLIFSFPLWRFWYTLTRLVVIFMDPSIRNASLFWLQGHVEGGRDRGEPSRALCLCGRGGELHHPRGGRDEEVHGESSVLQQSRVCPWGCSGEEGNWN